MTRRYEEAGTRGPELPTPLSSTRSAPPDKRRIFGHVHGARPLQHAAAMSRLRLLITATLVAMPQLAVGERLLTSLPHQESFDAESYADLVWTTQGCTHTWLADGGWRGGAATFTPPLTGEGACGLGQFILSNLPQIPEQLNVRFLIFHGRTWREYGPGNKLVIMNRDGNAGRPMIITREFEGTDATWETWGACDGTVCRYEEGDFWPLGGDRLKIGDPPLAREEEWISVELEANTTTGMIRLYVDTQDGALSGLYVERAMDDTGPGGTWSYIDLVGGYMAQAVQADPDNYYRIDELAVGSQRIGPPDGFVGSAGSDAGVGTDASGGADASSGGGNNPGDDSPSAGCGCRTQGGAGGAAQAALALSLVVVMRRRRR